MRAAEPGKHCSRSGSPRAARPSHGGKLDVREDLRHEQPRGRRGGRRGRRRRARLRVRGVAAPGHARSKRKRSAPACPRTSRASPSCAIRTRSTGSASSRSSSRIGCKPMPRISAGSSCRQSCTALPVYRDSNAPADSDLPDRLLFEGTHSGSGRVADWDEASGLARVAEVILAGGLTATMSPTPCASCALGRRRVERRRARAAARRTLHKIREFVARVRAIGADTDCPR